VSSTDDKQSLANQLRKLAAGDQHRSETARLRDVFDEIETALKAGVSRRAILETLHKNGFTMNLRTFDTALYRIRRERSKQQRSSAPEPAPSETDPARPDDLAGLDKKQRREKLADQFIKPETTNPLLKRINKKDDKE
jgi:hypothetical protein